jgi:hypothetical protein
MRLKLTTRGCFFDLSEVYQRVNDCYFDNKAEARITWGRRNRGKRKHHKSVLLGAYVLEDKLIRIHRTLDRSFVPKFFLESVVFHEMLHCMHEIPVVNGRHVFHTEEFNVRERAFEYYDAAVRWQEENLERLLYF